LKKLIENIIEDEPIAAEDEIARGLVVEAQKQALLRLTKEGEETKSTGKARQTSSQKLERVEETLSEETAQAESQAAVERSEKTRTDDLATIQQELLDSGSELKLTVEENLLTKPKEAETKDLSKVFSMASEDTSEEESRKGFVHDVPSTISEDKKSERFKDRRGY
jgi:hypothetical protein